MVDGKFSPRTAPRGTAIRIPARALIECAPSSFSSRAWICPALTPTGAAQAVILINPRSGRYGRWAVQARRLQNLTSARNGLPDFDENAFDRGRRPVGAPVEPKGRPSSTPSRRTFKKGQRTTARAGGGRSTRRSTPAHGCSIAVEGPSRIPAGVSSARTDHGGRQFGPASAESGTVTPPLCAL